MMAGGRFIAACILLLAGLPGAGLAQAPQKPATPVAPPTAVAPKVSPAAQPAGAPPLAPRGPWLPLPVLPKPLSPPLLAGGAAPVPPIPAAVEQPSPPPALPPVSPSSPSPPPVVEAGGGAITGGRAVWATAGIYIRAEPSAGGVVLDTLEKGQRATALAAPDSAGWVRIARGGKTGWVAGGYLTERDPDSGAESQSPGAAASDAKGAACLGPAPVPARVAAPGTRMRITTDTRIRREPSCDSPAIDVIDGGAVVTVTGGGDDGWYRIRGAGWDGVYVAAKLLAPLKR